MNKTEKEAFVVDFQDRINRAKLMIVTDFIGLDVESANELRSSLRAQQIEMTVVKNTLIKIAAKDTVLAQLDDVFVGPNAMVMVYGEDPVGPAKILNEFAKKHPVLNPKFGILDGKVLDGAALKRLADLPGKEILQAQLLGVLQAPARNMVSLMAQVPRSLLNVLNARSEQQAN